MGPLGDGGRFLDATDRELEDSEESGVSQDLWEYEEVVQRVTVKKKKVVLEQITITVSPGKKKRLSLSLETLNQDQLNKKKITCFIHCDIKLNN